MKSTPSSRAPSTKGSTPGVNVLPLEAIVDLAVPLEIAGAKSGKLKMRYPTVRDRMDAEEATETDAENELFLLARLTGLAPDDFRDMHLGDYRKCQVALGKFMGGQ